MSSFFKKLFCCDCYDKKPEDQIEESTRLLPPITNMPFRTKEINEKKQILLYGGAHPFIFDLKEIGDYRKYKVNKIVLGSNHGLVMFNNLNELGVFGSNQSGELGLPYKVNEMNFYDKLVLNKMKFLGMEDFKVIDIAAGENFSMVLIKFNNKKFPSLYKFHLNQTESNEVIHLEECETQAAIKKILVSSLRTILLTEDNSLYVKGNLFSLDISEKYKQIVKFDCNVTDLGMGNNDCLILLDDKKLFGIGDNAYGELGQLDVQYMNSPQEINFFKGKNVKKISLGARHSLVLTHEGNIYSFGDNSEGQCSGVEKAITVPRLVEFPNKDRIIDICCGYNHSVALSINGDIFTWGDSSTGKLGYPVYDSVQYYPKIIPFLKYRYINLIAAGPWQTCVAISNENEKDLLLN